MLAFGISPAGAVGDHVAVVAGDQVADDLSGRVELGGCGVCEAGADVVPEPEVRARRVGLARAPVLGALAVAGGGVVEVLVGQAGACEERVLPGGGVVGGGEVVVDEVDDEHGVDHPDARGEVAAAVVDVGVAAVARPVTHLAVDRDLQRAALGCGGERVEFAVDPVGGAGEDRSRAAGGRRG